jgi:hypothetical protein
MKTLKALTLAAMFGLSVSGEHVHLHESHVPEPKKVHAKIAR